MLDVPAVDWLMGMTLGYDGPMPDLNDGIGDPMAFRRQAAMAFITDPIVERYMKGPDDKPLLTKVYDVTR